jgi:putative chitinase
MKPELLDAATGCGPLRAQVWAPALTAAMDRFGIDVTTRRMAMFLAQVAHESDAFSVVIESMNYSAAGLLATWPEHFNTANAGAYAHNAQAIANRAYGNRMGNGDESSGDGWKYRGRGPLQTTGRADYRDCGATLGLDLVGAPDLLVRPDFGALAAGWEWNRGDLNDYADRGDFDSITRIINGGFIGQPDRLARWTRAKQALGVMS